MLSQHASAIKGIVLTSVSDSGASATSSPGSRPV
jgi:hypothetical protein